MKRIHVLVGVLFLLSACSSATASPSLVPATPPPTFPPIQFLTPTRTRAPVLTATASLIPTATVSPVPTPTWVLQGPGNVTVPILLYHRIDLSPINSRYYVPPETFEAEMKVLHDWGYASISVEMLVQAITHGKELPPRPVLLTFDDGHVDNYVNAFPIMKRYGFTGILYIVGNYLGTDGFMDREQILEMVNAGWEVGSHSLNHYDLTKLDPQRQKDEIAYSKQKLEDELGIDVTTFAFPFGAKDQAIISEVAAAGYIAAMGAEGYTDSQGEWNLFNLQRVEIKSSETPKTFTRFLTWQGPVP